jgi:hypothetical protein
MTAAAASEAAAADATGSSGAVFAAATAARTYPGGLNTGDGGSRGVVVVASTASRGFFGADDASATCTTTRGRGAATTGAAILIAGIALFFAPPPPSFVSGDHARARIFDASAAKDAGGGLGSLDARGEAARNASASFAARFPPYGDGLVLISPRFISRAFSTSGADVIGDVGSDVGFAAGEPSVSHASSMPASARAGSERISFPRERFAA